MSNTFNISVKPEIAALEAKVDIIDTEVDAIRATDLPDIETLIDTVDTVVDLIRSADVPGLTSEIDDNEAKIDIIDTNVDTLISRETIDLSAMTIQTGYNLIAGAGVQDVIDVNGAGYLIGTQLSPQNPVEKFSLLVTLDGTLIDFNYLAAPLGYTALLDALEHQIYSVYTVSRGFGTLPYSTTSLITAPICPGYGGFSLMKFNTSLLIQTERLVGASNAEISWIYGLI